MFYFIKSSFLNILVTLRYDKFVIRLSIDSACGFALVLHFVHDNFPYHTDTKPNN